MKIKFQVIKLSIESRIDKRSKVNLISNKFRTHFQDKFT